MLRPRGLELSIFHSRSHIHTLFASGEWPSYPAPHNRTIRTPLTVYYTQRQKCTHGRTWMRIAARAP